MNCSEAKEVLLLYRPGTADAADPQIAEALDLASRDPELRRWLDQHGAFQKVMCAKLQQIDVPACLRGSLLKTRGPRTSPSRSAPGHVARFL
jgi:hypothetical protein